MSSNKTLRILVNTFILVSLFLAILGTALTLFFSTYKTNLVKNMENNYSLNIDFYSNSMKKAILLLDKNQINEIYKKVVSTPFITDLKIKDAKYFFDKDTLLHHTISFSDDSWILTNVQTDIRFGKIKKLDSSKYYEFIPSNDFDKNEKLILRYQLFKNGELKNFVLALDMNLFEINNIITENTKNEYPFWFKYFYYYEIKDAIKQNISIDNSNIAELDFKLDDKILKDELYNFLSKIFFYILLIFLPSIIGLILYLKYIQNKYLISPIRYLDSIVEQSANFKFTNIDKNKFNNVEEFNNIINHVSKLTNKIASLKNEININKETIERNMYLDNLTSLFDKKMFEIDMKSMFVSSGNGYILYLKISKLFELSNLNGSLNTDNFIISFVNIINNTIDSFSKKEITFYRLQGSEFVIIAREIDYNETINLCANIIDNLQLQLPKNYNLPSDIFHIGATPFDLYGTIDSIMNSANEALETSKANYNNGFIVLNPEKINEENIKLENSVKSIVESSNFNIGFVFDSYSFEDKTLLMREVKPLLYTQDNKELPIGSFIAVCEKNGLNVDFDKDVITKAINYIKNYNVEYKLAINLSIKTISNIKFIDFLSSIKKQEKEAFSKILFSITSYAAATYNQEFIEFVEKMNDLDIEILLKRYKTKEYPIDELSRIKISYLRIDRDLTQNISNDLIKKHRIKNIVVYAQLNDINILTDNVESNKDYEYLSQLDLYATSR